MPLTLKKYCAVNITLGFPLQARERSLDAYKNLYPLVKQLLLIVSRPLRLLECLVSWQAASLIYIFFIHLHVSSFLYSLHSSCGYVTAEDFVITQPLCWEKLFVCMFNLLKQKKNGQNEAIKSNKKSHIWGNNIYKLMMFQRSPFSFSSTIINKNGTSTYFVCLAAPHVF